jgi:hypothetical protein
MPSLPTCWNTVWFDLIVVYSILLAESIVREKSPKEMREEVVNRCAHILASYREKCSENSPLGQLVS